MRTVRLHGAIGAEFGSEFRLAVDSPAEAVRALCTMIPKLRERLSAGLYQLYRGAQRLRRDTPAEGLHVRLGKHVRVIHIVPRLAGQGRGLGKILLGAVLVAASFAVPAAGVFGASVITGSTVAGLGASFALAGLSQVLAPSPRTSGGPAENGPSSNIFSDAVNAADPGSTIPVAFGETTVGSVVLSGAIHVETVREDDDE